MAQVAEFVEDNIVAKVRLHRHQPEVQVDIPLGRTTAPIGRIVLDKDPVIRKAVQGGQFCQPGRQFAFGLRPHRLDLLFRQAFPGNALRTLALQDGQHPIAPRPEKHDAGRIRHPPRNRHAHPLYRVNPHDDAPGTRAFAQPHRPDLFVLIDFFTVFRHRGIFLLQN